MDRSAGPDALSPRGPLDDSTHVVEELDGGTGIALDELARKLDVDRESDEVLLRAVMELALETPTLGVVGERRALTRGAKLVDLEAEPFERLVHLDVRKPHSATSCFEG